MIRWALMAAISVAALTGCSQTNSPAGPSQPNTPQPQTMTVSGTVRHANGSPIAGATVRILDGTRAGTMTTTDGSGRYSFTGLPQEGFTMIASAPGFIEKGEPVTPAATVTRDFSLLPTAVFSRSGIGDTVFDLPGSYITRLRITGHYAGTSSNFIVKVGGHLEVNELLGTFWGMIDYDGTQLVEGTVVEITLSSGVEWSITEVR